MIFSVNAEILALAVFDFIEGALTDFFEQLGHRYAFGFQFFREPSRAECIHHLEWSGFPVVAELHPVIDFNDRVGDFRNQKRGVGQCLAQHFPGVFPAFVFMLDNGLQSCFASIFGRQFYLVRFHILRFTKDLRIDFKRLFFFFRAG